jgi:hypothetical protein
LKVPKLGLTCRWRPSFLGYLDWNESLNLLDWFYWFDLFEWLKKCEEGIKIICQGKRVTCRLKPENDSSGLQEDPPSLKLRRDMQFRPENDPSLLYRAMPDRLVIKASRAVCIRILFSHMSPPDNHRDKQIHLEHS